MCLVAYLGSSTAVKELPWNPDEPSFNVSTEDEEIAEVRQHFRQPHVVYVGSHEHCGCGFRQEYATDEGWLRYPAEEESPGQVESTRRLESLIVDLLEASDPVEIYSPWSGNETEPPSSRRRLAVAEMTANGLALREGEFLVIHS